MRQQPVVIPAAGVFEILNEIVRDGLAGKVTNRFANRLAIGLHDFDKDAVHVEYDYFGGIHQICSNSSRKRRI